MTESVWNYPDELLLALGAFGLAPGRETPPSVVRDALNDLYRYELRRMRDELRAGRIAKPDYLDLVIAGNAEPDEWTARRVALLKSARYSVTRPLLLGAAIGTTEVVSCAVTSM